MGSSSEGFDSDSGCSDGERLMRLLRKSKRLHKELLRALSTSSLNIEPLNVAESLQWLLDFVTLALALCPKTCSDLWNINEQDQNVKDAVEKLQTSSHIAYRSICAKEKQLAEQQIRVNVIQASLQDLVGRVEHIERKSDTILRTLEESEQNWKETAAENEENLRHTKQRHEEFVRQQDEARERIKRKYEVNSNIFTGVGDFCSRKNDQFDLALSLGIGETEERRKDDMALDFYHAQVAGEESQLRSNYKRLEKISNRLCRLHEARVQIGKSARLTDKFRARAVDTTEKLIVRKHFLGQISFKLSDVENSVQMVDEETRMPSFAQVSTGVLLVLKATGKYQENEPELKAVNRSIWDILLANNDWEDLFDRDEELLDTFNEVEKLIE